MDRSISRRDVPADDERTECWVYDKATGDCWRADSDRFVLVGVPRDIGDVGAYLERVASDGHPTIGEAAQFGRRRELERITTDSMAIRIMRALRLDSSQ